MDCGGADNYRYAGDARSEVDLGGEGGLVGEVGARSARGLGGT